MATMKIMITSPKYALFPREFISIDWQGVDVDATLYESSRNGIFVDRITDSCVYLR